MNENQDSSKSSFRDQISMKTYQIKRMLTLRNGLKVENVGILGFWFATLGGRFGWDGRGFE